MKLENARIVRNIAGSVNRRVNCETANLMKTVDAAVRQTEDIRYLRDNGGLEQLPAGLGQAAELRLKMPDATLRELGEALDPPIGRSGVNHRLQRLSELAARLRGEEHPL
jgi:DNA-binding protein WhiA